MTASDIATLVVEIPTRLAFGVFLKRPAPMPKNGEKRWCAQGSTLRLTCQMSVPENVPCAWPIVPSIERMSDTRYEVQALSIGSDLKCPHAAPNSNLRCR